MPKATLKFPDKFLDMLEFAGRQAEPVIKNALKTAGGEAADITKSHLRAVLSGDSTGELAASLGCTPPKVDNSGNYNVKIGFYEPRSDGEINAKLANIIEYGKRGQAPKPFLAASKKDSKKIVITTIKDILEKGLKK